jgi:hypothetical protein
MLPTQIAKIAHELNRSYCQALGDNSQASWEDSPAWQTDSALAGVNYIISNPAITPKESHESWLAAKVADGWVYGAIKDPNAKTHPCCVPY